MARRTTRRARPEPPKVWHNPDVVGTRGDRPNGHLEGAAPASPVVTNGHAALAPRGKIVAAKAASLDDRQRECERLLARLGAAEGRAAVTVATDALRAAGHAIPEVDQLLQLQLLEHSNEECVRSAIRCLRTIFDAEPPKRPLVLDSRLRRLEELAEEPATREAAATLRRHVKTIELPPPGRS